MKRADTSSRKARTGDRKSFARPSTQVRRRAAEFKLESLEERTLLSTLLQTKVVPPASVPSGLGTSYTTLSEQAHGVGLQNQNPGQYTGGTTSTNGSSPETMAQLEDYLHKLKLNWDNLTNAGGGVPSPYQNHVSPTAGAPYPLPYQAYTQPSGNSPQDYYASHQDNPKEELFGKYAPNINDPGNQLQALAHNPLITGLSHPPLDPTVVNGFDGMNFLDSVNGYVPPDTNIAVGSQFVVEVVNSQIQFYDKVTGAAMLPNTPLNEFFGQPNESPFDPNVTYDDIAGRYIVTASTFSGHELMSVSKTGNPLDGFNSYDLDVSEGGNFPDFPKLGYNADEVVLTLNMYPGPSSFHVQVLSFAASSLFSSTPPPTLTLGSDYFSYDRAPNTDFTMVPAVMHGATAGMPMYFVQENGFNNGSSMLVSSATNLLSSSPSFTDTAVTVDPYSYPPSANQPGGSIATNDTRLLNAQWRDGLLVADHTIGLPTDFDAHARWYEFDVSGSPSLVQDGTISPAQGTSTYFPAIAIAPGDVIALTYNQSSPTEYASVYDTGRTAADPTGTMETPALAKAGDATYSDFAFRWGDYTGIAVDPVDGSLWSGAEYATSLLSGLPANWATWISHFSVAPTVISSDPAAGSIVTGTAPTTFSLTFSEPIDPASITASDFTVNGTAADSASISADDLTITYTFNTSPVVNQGSESMSLPAGAVKGLSDQIGNTAFSASFFYVVTQLQVSATSPPVGSILTAPVTDIVVQFNKDFDPYTVSTSDFQVSQGSVVSAVPLTSSTVDLTLSGVTQDGLLTLTLPAGAILDIYGVGNLAFSGTYVVDITTAPYPTPLQGKPPAGSLIYDPSVSGGISFAGDTDTYTLPLAANQNLSLVLSTDPSLIGVITLLDPMGNTVASATAASAGAQAVLETAPITTAGTYSLVVSGDAGSTGNYTLQAILNAVYKSASDPINSIGTAYDLSGAFAGLGTTPAADRAGVMGQLQGVSGGLNNFGYTVTSVSPSFIDITGTGTPTMQFYDDGYFSLDSSNLGGFKFIFYGQSYDSLYFSSNGLITFKQGDADFSNQDLSSSPSTPAISPFWDDQIIVNDSAPSAVYYQVEGSKLIIEWSNVSFYYNPSATPVTYEAVLDSSDNSIQFNYANLNAGYPPHDNGGSATVGIKDDNSGGGGADPIVLDFNSGPNAYVNSYTSTLFTAPLIPDDYYAVPLTAGELTTIAVKGTGGSATVGLYDASGNPLALSSSGKGVDGIISGFVAPTTGTYYAKVSGSGGLQYDLVVTRGSDFSVHGNSFANAQPLNGANVVLGAIAKGGGSLYTLDDQIYSAANPIWATDPATATFIPPSINAPGSPLDNPFGLNMAYDGTNLYYNMGAFNGDGGIYSIDPSSGAVLNQTTSPNSFFYTGLAYLNGKLYGASMVPYGFSNIDIFDASTLALIGSIPNNTGDSYLAGLAGDPDTGTLFAVGQTGGTGRLYEIDPATGNILREGNDNNQGFNEQDLAYVNGQLIVSDTVGFGAGANYLDYYDPSTFAFIQRLPVATQGFVSGLGGDGIGGISTDWYQFNVNAGDNLVLTTTTPGGSSANGLQFINDLAPTINLYDEAGNLVATATGNAGDGRNDVIDWTALTSGSYRVQILGSDKTNVGEYTIAIQGATGGLNAFTVTATDPAAGSDLNFQPTTMTVSVSNSTLLTSVSPSDLTIDGQSATGVTVIDSHDFSFSLPALSDGVHSVSISGLIDIHGVSLTPDNFTFETDTTPPYIVSSSIADGSIFSPAPQDVTEVITFSEPMNTSLTPSVDLFGEIRGIDYGTGTDTWDPTGTILTIVYNNLPSDAYQFNVYTYGFQDLAGNQLVSGLTTNFEVTAGTTSLSGLTPVLPLGSLVYQGTFDNVLADANQVDTYNLGIDPKQTLAVIVKPVTKTMTATVNLYSPAGILIGSATSPSPGAPAILYGVQSSKGGTYQFQVTGGPGEYTIQPILNAYVDPAAYGGSLNTSIATATPIDPYANKFIGHDDRTAVLGGLTSGGGGGTGLFSTDRFTQGLYSVDKSTGAATLIGPLSAFTSFSGMATDPSTGTTYISDVLGSDWSLATIDLTTGQESIIGPQFDSDVHALVWKDGTLYGFSYSQGEGTLNTSTGAFTPLFPFNTMPEVIENAAISPDGTVYGVGQSFGSIYSIDLNSGTATFLGNPGTGNFTLIGLAYTGGSLYELGYNGGDPNTPLWQIDPATIAGTVIGPNGMEFQPDAMTAPPGGGGGSAAETAATYSFTLNQGQSASVVLESLNGKSATVSLYDEDGNLLAVSYPGATNYTQGINNFVARSDGTYYAQVTGASGVKFNLVVTRGADFDTENHQTLATAQDVTATQQSGDSQQGGALGYLQNPNGANVGSVYEGIDFNGSNCGCLPPDTNAAVGGNYIIEMVNIQMRILDKTTGNILLDEPIDTFFSGLGVPTAGDPYVEYDTIANRWFVTAIDGNDNSKVELAVSNDANPLDGFSTQFLVPVSSAGSLADFPKYGYNADAFVIEANEFGDGHSVVTVIDKAQLLAGTLVTYQSTPSFNFRALTPAQMHGSNPGDPMWFMASTGDPTYDGTHPNTIRVTKMENILSNSPVYTDYAVSVNTYGPNSGAANQPGAPGSVATNDVSTTQVDYLNGSLVTALSASTPADGFVTTKTHWYQVDVTSGTPTLVQEGLVDPGSGVATFFPSATQDAAGDIGITYMESSSSEFVSAYVAGHIAGTPLGTTTAGSAYAPGTELEAVSFRNGDYSTVVLDPTDGMTFWAANEYAGPNSGSNIWHTKIGSFTLIAGVGTDFYSVNANAGDHLHFATSTPAGGPLEFVNNFYPELLLYDPNGNLVAIANGNAADGRNSVIDFTVPDGDAGKWTIVVTPSPSTDKPSQGEYGLLVSGATGSVAASFKVTSTIPADGALVQPPTDYIVTFSKPVYGLSLTPGELTINGVPAVQVTLVDAFTVDWTIDPSSIPHGNRVLNTAVISADPSTGQRVEDIEGAQLADFTSTFTTDDVAPSITDSSVHDGDVYSPAPYDLTEVVTFSEPMDTSFTTASSFDLFGQYRNQHIAAASFSWDSTGTVLTVNFAKLTEDVYTLTFFAIGFQDLVGHPLDHDYSYTFAVALGTAAFPTPFTPVPPLGDLIYTGSDNHVLVTPTDVNGLTLPLNAGGTLTLVGTPSDPSQQLIIAILDPSNAVIATVTAPAAGSNVVLETVPISTTGTYTIQISDAGGVLGVYDIKAYLNSYLKQGTSNITIGTATDISSSSYVLGPGNADRLAVVGSLPSDIITPGTVFVSSRYYGFYNSAQSVGDILQVNAAGQVVRVIPVDDPLYDTFGIPSLSGVELDPANNMLYAAVTTGTDFSSYVSGALQEFDPITGQYVATINLPVDAGFQGFFYPYGFSIAPDGTFWLSQPNSENIIHTDDMGNLLQSFSVSGTVPESASIGTDGNVYFTGVNGPDGSAIYKLDTTAGTYSYFAFSPSPNLTSTAPNGTGIWTGDFSYAALRYDYSGNLQQQIGYFGTNNAQNDPSGNVWTANTNYWDLFRFDPSGNQQIGFFVPLPIGVTTWGVDNPNTPPQDTQDFYKFDLTSGQSATIVAKSLNGKSLQITLVDGSGNVLATGVGGASNVTQDIENFVAPAAGTYYVEITGDPGVQYSLTVTRSANFDLEPNNTIDQAQNLDGTNGALGALKSGGTITVGQNFDGIDFNGSNCGCLPPDTNAAVGPAYVMETVNVQIRTFDKATGAIVDDQTLASFFGASSGGDPYVVYDDTAGRWYVIAFDSSDSGLFLKVSNDANPLDGWGQTFDLTNVGGFPDYPKMGFNKDAIFIGYNDFGSGGGNATIVAINKADAIAGVLTTNIIHPDFSQFRAIPPAQMHGDTTGGTEWFVSVEEGGGNTLQVTKLTDYFSSTPSIHTTMLPVTAFSPPFEADQPGGTWTIFPNTTTTQVQYRNGHLVTAMASGSASDGFFNPKGYYYQVDVSGGTPVLLQQGIIDPGPGVSVQMPSVAEDINGNLGFTWMEASPTEFLSMYVGTLNTSGQFTALASAPGGGFFDVNFRIGDYSSTVIDESDGTTFWSANEYIGSDGNSDIWKTHLTSFTIPPAQDDDWYSIDVQAGKGYSLFTQSYTPSDQGGQFINQVSVNLELYDTYGNLVSVGSDVGDGHNQAIFFNAPVTGRYFIHVFNSPGTSGEYFLSVDTASYQSGAIAGQVYNDHNGDGSNNGGSDPGLNGWEVDVFDSSGNFVASQVTGGNGNYDIAGLPAGTYTVHEVLQSGWTQTAPVPDYFWTVTVTAGATATGNDFGDYQNITISGEKFNDLDGNGVQDAGDPGLPGWTIDLLDASGAIVATTVTDADGNYSFSNVGPGTYTVQEELQSGWIQTYPAPPGTYSFTAISGGDQSGLNFGNFQLVTFAGQVYNDLNGDGSNDGGTDPGLQGWTVNLLDGSGNLLATTTSDVNGDYSFGNLGPGSYTIEEVNQDGWYQTQPVNPPGTYSVQAISSSNSSGLDFGNFQLVNLTGQVYNDLNADGSNDGGTDPGLQGWTVLLIDSSGNTVATTTSDANGNYEFDNLYPATFTIEEILQSGWTQTQPVNPNYYTVTTQSGMNQTGLDFGNSTTAFVSGQVYNDLNGDGSNDGGTDPGLQGWTVTLKDVAGNTVATTTSDSMGDYSFTIAQPGTYVIVETQQAGWTLTQPTSIVYTETVSSGDNLTGLDFGNFQNVSVSGNVYNDLNGNGQQNTGEPALQGWTVNVVNSGGTVVASAVSDANGNYTITGVGPGSFTLQEVVQSGWTITQPTNPSYYSFTSSSGVNVVGGIFGDFQTVSVSGNVYNDQDGNGQKTGQEPGLASWTVNLEDSSGNVLASVSTDASGNYTITGVGPGTYQVAEVVQTNWVQTQPLYPTVYSFTTQSGHNLTALRFGDHASPALNPAQVIDNGQAGYAETGTWTTATGGFNGTNRVARTTHGSGNTATASWTFTGLSTAFIYDVYVTFASKSAYSKAAPFTVYDNTTSLGTQYIDESILVTQAQGGRNEGSFGGVGWVELNASISVSSGTLVVTLGNHASGNSVDADGVLIVSHGVGRPQGSSPAPASSSLSAGPLSIGTLDATQPASGTTTKQGSGNGSTTAATIAISGVTQASPVNVVYTQAPAQSSSTSPSVVDMALSQNGNGSTQNGNVDVIGLLALDVLSRKKVTA